MGYGKARKAKSYIEKINKCIENGYSIIHIYQPDIWYDKYNWKNILRNAINDLKDKETQAVFISSNNCYDLHIKNIKDCIKIKCINYSL